MTEVPRWVSTDLSELIEDAVEYMCTQAAAEGTPVAGETLWKLVSCYGITKEAEFQGLVK